MKPKSLRGLAAVLCVFALLAGCSATEGLAPRAAKALELACRVDALAQPVLVSFAPEAFPGLAALVGTDQALVHPAVVALCKAAGGTPSAVTAVHS